MVARLGRDLELCRYIIEGDPWQELRVIFAVLPCLQALSQIDDSLLLRFAKCRLDAGERGLLGIEPTTVEPGVGGEREPHPVWIIEEQAAGEVGNVPRVLNGLPELGENRFDVQSGYRITAVDGGGERIHHELQPVGKMIAAHFALGKLQLMQFRFDLLLVYTMLGHLAQYLENQTLDRIAMLRLAAFDSANETGLAGRVVESTDRRGGGTERRRFQSATQRRGAVAKHHA